MENFLDVEHDLYEPVLTELPRTKLALKVEPTRVLIDEWVENLALEDAGRHGFRIICRNCQAETENGLLEDSLLAEIETFPVGELGTRVIWQRICWNEEHADGCILLQHLVLKLESLQTDLRHGTAKVGSLIFL